MRCPTIVDAALWRANLSSSITSEQEHLMIIPHQLDMSLLFCADNTTQVSEQIRMVRPAHFCRKHSSAANEVSS